MALRLNKIEVHALRGIRDLSLELRGKGFVLRGENGSGKSSFVDALEFLFTGKIRRLVGTGGLSLRSHGPHVEFQPQDTKVTIELDPGGAVVSRGLGSDPRVPEDLQSAWDAAARGNFILRRAQILEFINARDGERFEAMAVLVGLEPIVEMEGALQRARNVLIRQLEEVRRQQRVHYDAIGNLLGTAVGSAEQALTALNHALATDGLPALANWDGANEYRSRLVRGGPAGAQDETTRALARLSNLVTAMGSAGDLATQAGPAAARFNGTYSDAQRAAAKLLGFMVAGQELLLALSPELCLLCSQEISLDGLKVALAGRIETKRVEIHQLQQAAAALRPFRERLDAIRTGLGEVRNTAGTIPAAGEVGVDWDSLLNQGEALAHHISAAENIQGAFPLDALAAWVGTVDRTKDALASFASRRLGDVDARSVLAADKVLRIQTHLDQAFQLRDPVRKAVTAADAAEKTLTLLVNTKNEMVQAILDQISSDVDAFYSRIHPDEGSTGLQLNVNPGRRASLLLRAAFLGRDDQDPRAYGSEGHLDSLGLCIFLAFLKRYDAGLKIIVLDDVVTTIDSRHRQRICDLLFEEFRDCQIVITTHDGLWFQELRAAQRAHGLEADYSNAEIVAWSLNEGPRIRGAMTRWENVQNRLDDGDRAGAGNAGRQMLEDTLQECCSNLEAPVRYYRDGHPTLEDLWGAAKSRFAAKVQDATERQRIGDTFARVERSRFMGNLLSHANPDADQLSLDEVQEFCTAVRELGDAVSCTDCHNPLRLDRQTLVLQCTGRRCANPRRLAAR